MSYFGTPSFGGAAASQASAMSAASRAVSGVQRILRAGKARKSRKLPYGAGGGMMVTRNIANPVYIAPSTVSLTPQVQSSSMVFNLTGLAQASGPYVSGLGDPCFSMYFKAQDVTNWSDFSALFDQYRIVKIELTWRIIAAASSAAPTANTLLSNPTICWIEDYDDGILPSSTDSLRERMGLKMRQLVPGKPVRMSVRPTAIANFYPGGVTTSALAAGVPTKSPWFDIAQNTVPHFGIKGFIKEMDLRAVATPYYQITCEAKYFIEFKNVK